MRQRCFDLDHSAIQREAEPTCVQKQPTQAAGGNRMGGIQAVSAISRHGMADVPRMRADLMRAPGRRARIDQRPTGQALLYFKCGEGGLTFRRHHRMPLAMLPLGDIEGCINREPIGERTAEQEGAVVLAKIVGGQIGIECPQRRRILGQQQAARGFTVQSMDQIEPRRRRARQTGNIDEPVLKTGPTVNREPRGFVHHDHAGIFIEHPRLETGWVGDVSAALRPALLHAHWWETNLVASFQAGIRASAFAVDPNLSRSDQAIHRGARQPPQLPAQKIVEASPGLGVRDLDVTDLAA